MDSQSDASQTQTSTFTDNRVVIGQDGINAQSGGAVFAPRYTYALDNGAINRAFDTTDLSTQRALAFGTSALNTADQATAGALSFGDKALSKVLNFATDANAGAWAASDKLSTKAFNATSDALGFADSAFRGALTYTANITDGALANLQNTQQLTAAAYNDAKGRGALTDKIIIGAIGAMALVAFFAVKKGG